MSAHSYGMCFVQERYAHRRVTIYVF